MIRAMERLNPFVKAISVILAGLILGFSFSVVVNLLTAACCFVLLLVFSRCNKSALWKLMIPITISVISLFMTGYMNAGSGVTDSETVSKVSLAAFDTIAGRTGGSFYAGLSMSSRVLAFASLGILFALTTDGEEFILSLMHQGHVMPKFAYGILAALNLMPEIRAEYQASKLACKVRRTKTVWFFRPLFAAMVNCIRWSETLSMAMESKGFDGDGKRTFYKQMTVKAYDYLFLILPNGLIILGLILL